MGEVLAGCYEPVQLGWHAFTFSRNLVRRLIDVIVVVIVIAVIIVIVINVSTFLLMVIYWYKTNGECSRMDH